MSRLSKAENDRRAKMALAEGLLIARIRKGGGPFVASSLSQSFGVPVERARQIIIREGGANAIAQ